MKNLLIICFLLSSLVATAQPKKQTYQSIYKGKIGISFIEFKAGNHLDGSIATITTGKSIDTYNYCSEEENPKVQKLCWYSKDKGYNYKRNLKINLPFATKKLPNVIAGTYYVNGEPVSFKLFKEK